MTRQPTQREVSILVADAFRLGVGTSVGAIEGYARDHPEIAGHLDALALLLREKTADFVLDES